jgi:hypothetical protein
MCWNLSFIQWYWVLCKDSLQMRNTAWKISWHTQMQGAGGAGQGAGDYRDWGDVPRSVGQLPPVPADYCVLRMQYILCGWTF